jgi:hypothetical protein
MFSSLFRGKKNTTNTTRRSNKNMRNAAATQAHWKVRSKYGRAAQSRVANVLRPNEGPHNYVAKEQKQLAEQIFVELDGITKSITPEQQAVISDVRDNIQSDVQRAVQSGADRMTITVPTFIGSLLVRLLGILLGLALLGGLIAAFIIAPVITGPAVGASIAGAGVLGLFGGMARNYYLRRTPAGLAAAKHKRLQEIRARRAAWEAANAQDPNEPGARNRAYGNAYHGEYRKMEEEEAAEKAEAKAAKSVQWRGTSTGAVPSAATTVTTATTATTATKANNTPEIALHRADAVAAANWAKYAANTNAAIAEADALKAAEAAARGTRRNRPPLYPKNKVTGKMPQGIAAGGGGGGAANRNTRKNRN